MAQGTIHLLERDWRGYITFDEVICGKCCEEHLSHEMKRGDRRTLRPYEGPARECGWCRDEQHEGVIPGLKQERGQWVLSR